MRVKCTHSGIQDGSSSFVEGGIYDALYDGEYTYLLGNEGDRLYFNLKTGRCSWINKGRSSKWFSFEEVKEQPYATSPEVLAQVFRRMADNILAGLEPCEGIQFKVEGALWCGTREVNHLEEFEYRVKPDTITLKNGIEVPKPLSLEESKHMQGTSIYLPSSRARGYTQHAGATLYTEWHPLALFYKTKEEAIEASKALFGLEIKE